MRRRATLRAAMLTSLVAALVGGCAVGGSTTSTGLAGWVGPARTPAKALSEYVLRQSDLPAGFTVLDIGRARQQEAIDAVMGAVRSSRVTPAKCAGDIDSALPSPERYAIAQFVDNRFTAVSAAVLGGQTIAALRATSTGDCARQTVQSTVDGVAVSAVVEGRTLDIAVAGIDDPFVLEQTATSQVPGGPTVRTRQLQAFFVVDGVSVTVGLQSQLGSDTAPDVPLFTRLVGAAAARATA